VIGMLDSPSSGSYLFDGTEVSGLGEAKLADFRKRNIGFIFQSFNLVDELTVARISSSPCSTTRCRRRSSRAGRAGDGPGRHRPPRRHRPSQLAAAAAARRRRPRLVGCPKLILADEPTGNLDTAHGEEVMRMLQALNQEGSTIVMVTHSPAHADYASRVVNMLDGRVWSSTGGRHEPGSLPPRRGWR
jgi:putative ABC transport system ATP-binding protein